MKNEEVSVTAIETTERRFTKPENLRGFWQLIQNLILTKVMVKDCDYKVVCKETIIRRFYKNGLWLTEKIVLDQPEQLLYLNANGMFKFYKAPVLIPPGERRMPLSTLKFYLHNSKEFVCYTKKESFKKIDYRTGKQEVDLKTKKRTSTSALIFYLNGIGLQIESTEDN